VPSLAYSGDLIKKNAKVMVVHILSEWVIGVECQHSNFSAISWQEQVNFQWDDDKVLFVLDQNA
jgi:hypothetical protein